MWKTFDNGDKENWSLMFEFDVCFQYAPKSVEHFKSVPMWIKISKNLEKMPLKFTPHGNM